MYGYIYLTTNTINNKKYIGQRKFNGDPLKDSYLGSGKILKQAIKKYGKNSFTKEILDICESNDELIEKEKYWIEKFEATKSKEFYNIHVGGKGGNVISGYSEDEMIITRNNRSKAYKTFFNSLNEEAQKEYFDTVRRNAIKGGEAFKKIGHTSEFKANLSKRMKEANNPMYGKSRTKESIEKQLKTRDENRKAKGIVYKYELKEKSSGRVYETGWHHSDETKKKISEATYKRYNSFSLEKETILMLNKDLSLEGKFFGIEEFFSFIGKNTYSAEQCLRKAIKNNKLYRNKYWKIESQSTIENIN